MKRRFVKSETTQRVDPQTGEIIQVDVKKVHEIKLEEKDRFVMIYYEMLKTFYQIKYIKDVFLLIKLVEMANYNTGEVSISTAKREKLCEELQVKNPNLSSMFKRLTELELIEGSRGEYKINEAAFWKGDNKTRLEMLKDKGIEFTIKFKL